MATGFSVLMSTYRNDDPEHVAIALDSVLNQSVKTDDLVLVLDGPLEGVLNDLVTQYAAHHSEIRLLPLRENVGLGQALAAGLAETRHEIVARMDADDVARPDRFDQQLAFLDAHPEVGLLSAPVDEFEDNDPSKVFTVRAVPATDAEIRRFAQSWNPMNHPAVVFRKSEVEAVGGYQHFSRHEDYHLWVRMLMNGTVAANLTDSLVAYRISRANLNRRRNWATVVDALRFHWWKYRVGFAPLPRTLVMFAMSLAYWLTPEPIFRGIYRRMRAPVSVPSSDNGKMNSW